MDRKIIKKNILLLVGVDVVGIVFLLSIQTTKLLCGISSFNKLNQIKLNKEFKQQKAKLVPIWEVANAEENLTWFCWIVNVAIRKYWISWCIL